MCLGLKSSNNGGFLHYVVLNLDKKKPTCESQANTAFLNAFVFPFIPYTEQHCVVVVVVLSAMLLEVRDKEKMLMISLWA